MNPCIKNLVFEGGGVKGIAYGGALTRLKELGYLQGLKRVAGTSAGAITATLLAIGYTPQEISDIISQTNFNDFADDDTGFFRDLYRFIKHFGWHKGDKFTNWISKLLNQKLKNPNITFQELHQLSKTNPQIKDLYIVGSNLSKQASEIYSHETTPNMQIKQAVRISMSIPFYFKAVVNQFKETLVDGGVIRNYPINIFDHSKYQEEPETQGYLFNKETIGFRLADKDSLEANLKSKKIKGLKSFTWALVTFMQSMASKLHVHKDDWNRTIAIDTTGVGVTEFNLTRGQILELILQGELGVENYLKWLESASTLAPN